MFSSFQRKIIQVIRPTKKGISLPTLMSIAMTELLKLQS